ncbi:hypothetical protein LEP1GSC073_3026 [Leptospira noguchii str. Cascata]|nr:hypothetical protein LEP1GSC073_3026 [Leptospira noguchii str. Cascata]
MLNENRIYKIYKVFEKKFQKRRYKIFFDLFLIAVESD